MVVTFEGSRSLPDGRLGIFGVLLKVFLEVCGGRHEDRLEVAQVGCHFAPSQFPFSDGRSEIAGTGNSRWGVVPVSY